MKDLSQPFSNGEFDLTIEAHPSDGFRVLAPELARALGFRQALDLTRGIPDGEKGYALVRTPGGEQRVGYLTEAGFYRALGQRQAARITDPTIRDQVERFQTWVYSDVLPSIRRHGLYAAPQTVEAMLDDPDVMIGLLEQIKAERAEKSALAAKVEQDAPKVLYADSVSVSGTRTLVSGLAVVLKANGVDVGANRLFEWLRRDGYLCSRKGRDWNRPTQRAMDLGLFEPDDIVITHSDGRISERTTPLVTGKGRIYFVNKYAARAAVPA